MKINDLSKELGITNKELIAFFKDNGYPKITSHNQKVEDDMYKLATKHFEKVETPDRKEDKEEAVATSVKTKKDISSIMPEQRVFKSDDVISVKSVTPWELVTVGVDKNTVYHWSGYGDVEYITYRDLQSLRRKELITKTKVVIEDPDLCYQWRRDLGDTYKYFLGVEYPEEFFELPDDKFEEMLKSAPDTVQEVLKVTAMNMIKNENYPSVQKIRLIDDILGTVMRDFL